MMTDRIRKKRIAAAYALFMLALIGVMTVAMAVVAFVAL